MKSILIFALGLLALQFSEAHPPGRGPPGNHDRKRPCNNGNSRPTSTTPSSSTPAPSPSGDSDTRSLDEIYAAAVKEGGKLIVYAGGDVPYQQNSVKKAFEARFPKINLEIIVDFSKVHDARVDMQVETGRIIPDVVQLQTTEDFERWANLSLLMAYKPLGWDQVFPEFKDPNGFWTALRTITFSNSVNTNLLGNDSSKWPIEPKDYLRPELKGKIVTTWPNDDDAVLFVFYKIVQKEGFSWLQKFAEQNPILVRGTQYPLDMVANGTAAATIAASSGSVLLSKQTGVKRSYLPKQGPFLTWGQRAAILKATKRPNAAKLYMAWGIDAATQKSAVLPYAWSVRQDIPLPEGAKPLKDYKGQLDINEFPAFMRDRAEVERFKQQIRIFFGDPKGPSPPGELGPYPEKMLPGTYP